MKAKNFGIGLIRIILNFELQGPLIAKLGFKSQACVEFGDT